MQQLTISIIFSLLTALTLTASSLKLVNILQLSSYKTRPTIEWLKRTKFNFLVRCFGLSVFVYSPLIIFCVCFPDNYARFFGMPIFLFLTSYFAFTLHQEKQKTPLKYTKRIKRLLILLYFLYFFASFILIYPLFYTKIGYSLIGILPVFIAVFVFLAHALISPIEKLVNNYYLNMAKNRLNSTKIIKIGITGSYGKTTAKNILSTLLGQKFKVLASPSSHNTPMGLSKLINGGIDGFDVLIAEMGAKHIGDIAELADFICPNYGIITSIGTQHLATFGSVENILKTKFELAMACEFCVINADEPMLVEECKKTLAKAERSGIFGKTTADNEKMSVTDGQNLVNAENSLDGCNTVDSHNALDDCTLDGRNTVDSHNALDGCNTIDGRNAIDGCNTIDGCSAIDVQNAIDAEEKLGRQIKIEFIFSGENGVDASYYDVNVTQNGTEFTIKIGQETAEIKVRLLGRHIPPLFTQCAVLAHKMGVSLSEIQDLATKIEPVPHRLQLIKTPLGAVIDDAFNSNPIGAKNALEVLSKFDGQRVVITPGFIELGQIEIQKNFELGEQVRNNADYLICVKNNDIYNGALNAKMEKSNIFMVDSLILAMEKLKELNLNKPIILFLNDLPDNY